jgi:hypothetical protein
MTGSYKVGLKRKSGLAANAWQLIHPKRQILTKTDIARYEMTLSCQPHLVSSGAQKNIAAFGKDISKRWDADPETFDIEYFKQMVVKSILTRAVDSLIPAQPWYPGSILRPLSSYTLALMSLRMHNWIGNLTMKRSGAHRKRHRCFSMKPCASHSRYCRCCRNTRRTGPHSPGHGVGQ